MKRGWDNVARPGTGAYWDQVWFVVLGAGAGICSGVSETIGVSLAVTGLSNRRSQQTQPRHHFI